MQRISCVKAATNMNHAHTARMPLSRHLRPSARAAILAGEPTTVRAMLTLAPDADVNEITDAARGLHCTVRGYIKQGRLLGLVASVKVLDDLARLDGVVSLETERIPHRR